MEMMKGNITVEQYLKIFEEAKSAVLYDMDSFDMDELHNPKNPVFSVLGVTLRCRDDEDAFWVIGYDRPQLFLRFNPDLMKYMKQESRGFLEDDEPLKESARDKLYWEVTKYTKIKNTMQQMYTAYFSLNCELIDIYSRFGRNVNEKSIIQTLGCPMHSAFCLTAHGSYTTP